MDITATELEGIDYTDKLQFKAFPNPAYDQVTVLLTGQFENATLTLSDVTGKLIFEQELENNHPLYHLNLTDYRAGVYLLTVRLEDGTVRTEKLIVNK